MRSLLIVAGFLAGVTSVTGAVADPSNPLAADDPNNASGWRPPPSPTAGSEGFAPVEAKNWLELNKGASSNDGSMKGMTMKGMDMKGMPGMSGSMPGMGGSK